MAAILVRRKSGVNHLNAVDGSLMDLKALFWNYELW
jgi:hypothetical protein